MFDFEKLPIYIKTELLIQKLQSLLKDSSIDLNIRDQLRRASLSILLNFSEGAGKYSKKDKKRFYIIARGSNQECAAIINILKMQAIIDENYHKEIYDL